MAKNVRDKKMNSEPAASTPQDPHTEELQGQEAPGAQDEGDDSGDPSDPEDDPTHH